MKIKKSKTLMHAFMLAICFLMLNSLTKIEAQSVKIPDNWSDGYVYANGIRIHYYHAMPAAGKPVMVMVHGVTDIGLCWTTLALKLQDSYDIYMTDTRGHGLSDPFTSSDNGETLVKDVVEFVRAMKFEKPILMGHSMGAATVMRVGAEYPDIAKAIIMLDPMLGNFFGGPSKEGGKTKANPAPKVPQTEVKTPNQLSVNMTGSPETLVMQNNYKFDDLVATCHCNTPKWDSIDCQYWALSKKQYHGPYTSEAWQAMSGTMKTDDALSKITVPALILKADATPEVRKANEKAASVMQKGKLVHINGAGHNLHHDELQQTFNVLNQFLSTI